MKIINYTHIPIIFLGLTAIFLLITHDFLTTILNISVYYNQVARELNRISENNIPIHTTNYLGQKIDFNFMRWYYDFMIVIIIIIVGLIIFLTLYSKSRIQRNPQDSFSAKNAEKGQIITKLSQTLPTLIGVLLLTFIITDFFRILVKLIARHDQMALLLRTSYGYGTPDYYTYFFNKKVYLSFIKTVYFVSSLLNVVLLGIILSLSTVYFRKYKRLKFYKF